MNKYDKMIEENQKKSKEKIELAQRTIQDMISNKERISVPKLMKKTGLSKSCFLLCNENGVARYPKDVLSEPEYCFPIDKRAVVWYTKNR